MNFVSDFPPFWQLIWRATWQAGILACLVFCVLLLLQRWISPKWRALLWTVPLVRLVLLIVPASGLSLFQLFSIEPNRIPQVADSLMTVPTETMIRSSPGPQLSTSHNSVQTHTTDEQNVHHAAMIPPATESNVRISSSNLITGLWFLGFCILLIREIGSRWMLSRLIANSQPLHDSELVTLIAARQKQGFLKSPVRCIVTDAELGPSSCGFWRPTILLPRSLWEDFDQKSRRAIVYHELEHIRRHDALLLSLSRIAIAVHWFNPLVYLITGRLRREIELAVDAATVAAFDEQTRHHYGELLIQLSQYSQKPIAALPMAGKRSALRARISQLTNPIRESRPRSALAICVLLLFLVTGLSDAAQKKEQPEQNQKSPAVSTRQEQLSESKPTAQYFITGTVRDVHTGKPVSNAEIQVLVESEPDINKKILKVKTNAAGEYRLEVPVGNVRLWLPALKPGYWLKPADSLQALATTPENPILKHDIAAQTGPIWNVHWKGELTDQQVKLLRAHSREGSLQLRLSVQEVEDDAKRAAWLKGEPVSFQKSIASSLSYLDQAGRGKLTQVGTSGKYILMLVNDLAELIVEPGFDNTRVISLKRIPETDQTEMIDASGKTATVSKATVTLNHGVPLLTFQIKAPKPLGMQKMSGRVVDENGKPLKDVRVGIVSGMQGGGNADTGESTQTAIDGRFSIKLPVYDNQVFQNQQFSVMLTKDGFAGTDSEVVDVQKDFAPIDFKTLTLQPGHTLPIQVLDEREQPLPGAILEPGNDYALRRQITRTDSTGRAVLKNLPSGVVHTSIRWGTKIKEANLVVSKNQSENREVTIHVNEFVPSTTSRVEKPKPLAVGQQAPEWEIPQWSDGRLHKLSDYRGQVVVLDFWGLWCRGCVTSIPAQIKLAQKYGAQGVVFLGIHTAEGEMSQIKKLQQSEEWTTPTGIDRGTSILNSVTCERYGVQGYPTQIIIDRKGRIAFRSDIEPPGNRETYIRKLAEASGVKWPPAENATEVELTDIMNRVQYTLLSREIERVLQTKD
tara:strand:- start:1816 stop:4887 length:3072 start_codon:yes stop_codon:yes gene_type:complete